MAVIDPDSYDEIQGYYAAAERQLSGVTDYYYQAAYVVVLLNVFDPELDLLRPMYEAWRSAVSYYDTSPLSTLESVRRLQNHILVRSGAADVDTWYAANALTVDQEFADLSEAVGYPIDAAYIA